MYLLIIVMTCLCLDTSTCRWVVHSGESLPAWRCERWQLAYCSHSLLQQGGFHISLFVSPGPFRFSVSLLIFHSVSQMSVWWVILWSFYILLVIICTVLLICLHISFSVSRALWIELTGLCMALCGRLPVTISFMHIHRTSPLIFFMFFHSPQPTTRYVSMSVSKCTYTSFVSFSFFPFYLSVFFFCQKSECLCFYSIIFLPMCSSICFLSY